VVDVVLTSKQIHQQPMVSYRMSDHALLYRKHAVHSHAAPQRTMALQPRTVLHQTTTVTSAPYRSTDIVKKGVTVVLAHTQVESEDRSYEIDDVFVKIAAIEAEDPIQSNSRRLQKAL